MNVIIDLQDRLYGEGRADRTVREYVKWAKRLGRWCVLHGLDIETVTADQVRAWIDQTVPPGRESRKQAHAATRHLYTMLGRTDAPWEAIRVPRKRASEPHPLTETEARTLRDGATMMGGRAGTATLGLLFTACRTSEVAGWRWDGVDLDELTLRFWRPKVRDWLTVAVRPELAEALERFRPAGAEGYVFAGDRGRPHVAGATVWTWTRRVAETVGVVGVNPRRLRATWACHALEATGDIDAVAGVLGHSSTETTRRYYTITSMRRKREAAAAVPW